MRHKRFKVWPVRLDRSLVNWKANRTRGEGQKTEKFVSLLTAPNDPENHLTHVSISRHHIRTRINSISLQAMFFLCSSFCRSWKEKALAESELARRVCGYIQQQQHMCVLCVREREKKKTRKQNGMKGECKKKKVFGVDGGEWNVGDVL